MSDEARKAYLSVDRAREREEFLRRHGKTLPPDLLAGKDRFGNAIDPWAQPRAPKFSTRASSRFLVMRGASGSNLIGLDDHGTCEAQEHVSRHWHRYSAEPVYEGGPPILVVLRCPNSLSQDEWARTFNTRAEAFEWANNNPLGKKDRNVSQSKSSWED